MSTVTQPRGNEAPAVLGHEQFRSRVRDYLVTLGNKRSGLGVKVTGVENAVVVYPRAGRPLATFAEFLGLKWLEANVESLEHDSPISFKELTEEEAKAFLESIRPA